MNPEHQGMAGDSKRGRCPDIANLAHGAADSDGDGYTNLEADLNSLTPTKN